MYKLTIYNVTGTLTVVECESTDEVFRIGDHFVAKGWQFSIETMA